MRKLIIKILKRFGLVAIEYREAPRKRHYFYFVSFNYTYKKYENGTSVGWDYGNCTITTPDRPQSYEDITALEFIIEQNLLRKMGHIGPKALINNLLLLEVKEIPQHGNNATVSK